MSKKPTKPTTKKETHHVGQKSRRPLYLLGALLAALLLYAAFNSYKPATKLGIGQPLDNTPKAQIEVLDPETPTPEKTPEIVDITNTVNQPFPQRTIAPAPLAPARTEGALTNNLKEHNIPEDIATPQPEAPENTTLKQAELVQATLTLAKQQAERQTHMAELHTLIALIQNPTQTPTEQAQWAELGVNTAQHLNATALADAFNAFAKPTKVDTLPAEEKPKTTPWLAPFKNLIQIQRTDTAAAKSAPDALKNLLSAYHSFLIQEERP